MLASRVMATVEGLGPTDLAYLEARERAMAIYYPDYASRPPEELLRTSYAGVAAAPSRASRAVGAQVERPAAATACAGSGGAGGRLAGSLEPTAAAQT